MKKTATIAIGILVFIIIIIIVTFLEGLKKPRDEKPTTPAPSASGYNSGEMGPDTRTRYDSGGSKKLLEVVLTRPPASPPDDAIRKEIIDSIDNKTGVLIKTDRYLLEYIKNPDVFEVEITTQDVSSVKEEVVGWFLEKGMTSEGICRLPLAFYPSPEVGRELTSKNIEFSPIPDFCK